MRVYIAGPMTGLPDFNRSAFDAAARQLWKVGHIPLNPADLSRFEEPTGADGYDGRARKRLESYVRTDLAVLLTAEAIFLLPGWSEAPGAQLENAVALGIGLELMGGSAEK